MRRPRKEPDRSVFKADAAYAVSQRINELEMLEMTTMVEPRMTATKVLDLLFPEHIDLLRAAGAIAATIPATVAPIGIAYGLQPEDLAFMRVAWDELKTIAPAISAPYAPPPVVSSQLTDMLVITRKWWRVRRVFKFLNEHCRSPASFRSVWPCIVSLAREGHPVRIVDGKKNMDIPHIGAMLSAIRDTQATVANALLLPPIETPMSYQIFVRFNEPGPSSQYFGFA